MRNNLLVHSERVKKYKKYFLQSCTDQKIKLRSYIEASLSPLFLFVSGREVPSAADSLRANRFFLSLRNTVHRNTQKAAFHRENVISNRKCQRHIGRADSYISR